MACLFVKTVGTLGGFALLFNNVTGPGIASIAQVYQSSGWVVTTLAFLIFGILATFCSLLLVESVQSVPGNAHFQGQVEFSTLINFYFGKRAHRVGQFFLWATLESTAILSIIQSSQAMDNLLIDIFGRTCGLALGPAVTGWTCITTRQESLSSFGNVFTLFTLGFLLVVVLILPMSLFVSMDGNIWVQTGVHFVTIYIFVQWFISSCVKGLDRHLVPPIGSGSGFAQLFGVVMLNYASVTTVPSWVNVRKKSVNIQSSLWSSNMFACLSFVLLGAVPGSAFLIPDDSNFISIVALHDTLNRVDSYLFTISLIMSSIPVFFLIARDNLVHNQILTQARATWFTHVLPWFIAIPFLNGPFLTYLTVWTSLVFASVTNFTIPVLIYYKARRFRRIYNERRRPAPGAAAAFKAPRESDEHVDAAMALRAVQQPSGQRNEHRR
ncbi:hypothetical protein CXG81DRAFT_29850 [Caulochytrium protostelioides]|uniref:Amino acid transporter transmembrane domain-containing protein n=1 Tax=Caulochytrium protostelioides TaxID=1555241 RepID=A0A4P9X731_9FUNG|nr:hypothetical protein CXG81DRAFT_29850 [Caulochytrium protostelioides]|eukprot:RKP01024.1 hypothetical protein CXG81DRAFT_29850 [Caulochytrium protostelioides]